jgi:hypothetical protein
LQPDDSKDPVTLPKPIRILLGLSAFFVASIAAVILLSVYFAGQDLDPLPSHAVSEESRSAIDSVDAAFERDWADKEISPVPNASTHTVVRRLSLALTGAVPSLEELRRLETLPDDADPVQSWLDHLFADPRYHGYFAERLARTYVGVDPGPFLVFRRRRLVNWLADQLEANRPYDALVRDIVASEGLWTSNPETNFVTVTIVEGGDKGPDEAKLAGRTSRAFLGISLDCMQCHDDKFGDHWKQEHFHQFAAFYGQAEMGLTGVRENGSKEYETRYLGQADPDVITASVPFQEDLLPEDGTRRSRLARWITDDRNEAFARATVNRTWALLTGRPLHDPVDDIPLEGPFPAGLQELADSFVENNHDLQGLIRLIAASRPFRLDSSTAEAATPVTQAQDAAWAAFPVTPLRPEQVAGSIIQSASLQALDRGAHIISKLRRFGETQDFVKRYGDQGEDEFREEAGTIPQRLLLMNGKLVSERTKPNPIMNSSTRVAQYAGSDQDAIDAAFLTALTRLPNEEESAHFSALLEGKKANARQLAMEDIYWALINSTEFSWNR